MVFDLITTKLNKYYYYNACSYINSRLHTNTEKPDEANHVGGQRCVVRWI